MKIYKLVLFGSIATLILSSCKKENAFISKDDKNKLEFINLTNQDYNGTWNSTTKECKGRKFDCYEGPMYTGNMNHLNELNFSISIGPERVATFMASDDANDLREYFGGFIEAVASGEKAVIYEYDEARSRYNYYFGNVNNLTFENFEGVVTIEIE
jgi:hypothetical protein